MKNIYDQLNNDLVFDIGANTGNRIEEFLKRNCKVVAVEPQVELYNQLVIKYGNNPNVILLNCAVSDTIGEKELYVSNAHTITTMSKEFIEETKKDRFKSYKWDTMNPTIVKTITLDNMIYLYGMPSFCKIDIEGYEYYAIKGLNYAIPFISIEYTPELHQNTMLCLQHLKSLSSTYMYNVSVGESLLYVSGDYVPYDEIENLIKTNIYGTYLFGDIYIKNN